MIKKISAVVIGICLLFGVVACNNNNNQGGSTNTPQPTLSSHKYKYMNYQTCISVERTDGKGDKFLAENNLDKVKEAVDAVEDAINRDTATDKLIEELKATNPIGIKYTFNDIVVNVFPAIENGKPSKNQIIMEFVGDDSSAYHSLDSEFSAEFFAEASLDKFFNVK